MLNLTSAALKVFLALDPCDMRKSFNGLNCVENMIRPTKLGMKNWMFFGSLEAGTNNALSYTLLANCRAQNLDPEDFLVEVIKRLPPDATPNQAAALTPARIAAERRAQKETEEVA